MSAGKPPMVARILKPIGAKLPNCELPGGSFVNTEVIKGLDGSPDLRLTNPTTGPIDVSFFDLHVGEHGVT